MPDAQPSAGQPASSTAEAENQRLRAELAAQTRACDALRAREARYQGIIASMTDGVLLTDEDGTLVEFNPAMEALTGLRRDQALGMMIWDLQAQLLPVERRTPAARARVKAMCQEALASGQAAVLGHPPQAVFARPDGSRRTVAQDVLALRTSQGFCFGGLAHDISVQAEAEQSRAQAEEALRQREAELQTLIENLPCGVFVKDRAGRYTRVNHAYEHMAGLRADEILGKTLRELTPDMAEAWMAEDEALYATGEMQVFEQRMPPSLRGRSATEVFETRKVPLRDDHGAVVGLIGVSLDLSERRRGEEARMQAEQSAARLAALVEASGDAIIGGDPRGVIQSWNPGAERLYGYTAEEAIGHSFTMLLPPERRDEVARVLEHVLQQGQQVAAFESERLRKDGSRVDVSISVWPVRNAQGAIVGSGSITRDVTARKHAEREREALIAQLQEALANVRTLRGLVPICANCKKIRDDTGYWQQVEVYVRAHTEAEFSHGICPDCMRKLYPEYAKPETP